MTIAIDGYGAIYRRRCGIAPTLARLSLGLVLGLSACEAAPGVGEAPHARQAEEPPARIEDGSAAARPAPRPPEEARLDGAAGRALGGRTVRPLSPVGPLIEPAALLGLEPNQAAIVLGRPSAVREDAPALVWTYRAGEDCVVDLYFYTSVDSPVRRLLALEVAGPGKSEQAQSECFNRVVKDSHDRR